VKMDASPDQVLIVSATYQRAFEDRVVQTGA